MSDSRERDGWPDPATAERLLRGEYAAAYAGPAGVAGPAAGDRAAGPAGVAEADRGYGSGTGSAAAGTADRGRGLGAGPAGAADAHRCAADTGPAAAAGPHPDSEAASVRGRVTALARLLSVAAEPRGFAPEREQAVLAAFRREFGGRRKRARRPGKAMGGALAAVFVLGGAAIAAQNAGLTHPFGDGRPSAGVAKGATLAAATSPAPASLPTPSESPELPGPATPDVRTTPVTVPTTPPALPTSPLPTHLPH